MNDLTKFLVLRTVWRVTKWSVRVSARYVSGRPLNGKIYTDSSRHFLRPGSKPLTPDGVASGWAMMPGWKRAAWRVGLPGSVGLSLYSHAQAPLATDAALVALATGGTVVGARKAVRKVRRRQISRVYVRPLAAALAGPLNQDEHRPDKWLHVPEDLAANLRPGILDRVAVPSWVRTPVALVRLAGRVQRYTDRRKLARGKDAGWIRIPIAQLSTPEARGLIDLALSDKVHDDLIIEWHTKGIDPHVTFRARPRPPENVTWADIRELVKSANPAAPILGLTAEGGYAIDLDIDSPHIALSCGSGAGKSILLRLLIAQWLHNGAQVVILDGKRTSQRWCKDLPGVTYCRTGEEMYDQLMELQEEAMRRAAIVDEIPADSDEIPDVGPRVVVVFEEQNIGMQMILEYWRSIKQKGDPARPPAASALDTLLCAGREFMMNVVSIAQLFTVQASGGNPAARVNYGKRILARADRNAWMMLAPECAPFPKQSKRRGRMHVASSGNLTELQVALLSVSEAREWATSGDQVTVPVTWTTPADQRHTSQGVTSEPLLSLAEIARQRVIPLTYGALRNAKSKAGDAFPQPIMVGNTPKYRPADIKAWNAARFEAEESAEEAAETPATD